MSLTTVFSSAPPKAILALRQTTQSDDARVDVKPSSFKKDLASLTTDVKPTARPFTPRKRAPARVMNEQELLNLAIRKERGTHFPVDPRPSDHVAFLHCDYMHDTTQALRNFFGIRRLGAIEDRNKTKLYDGYASKTSVEVGLAHINELIGEEKVYATQSTFKWGWWGDKDRHRCSRKYLTSISTLFVDVDIYADNSALKHLSKQQAADAILARLDEHNIPHPVIIDSGRGFYLDWALGERLSLRRATVFELWQKVQVKLIDLFYDFGADAKVKDLTRVLRLVGTINEKNGKTVKVINDDGQYYSLKTLEKSVKHLDTPEGWLPKIINPTKAQKKRFTKVIETSKRAKAKVNAKAKANGKALGKLASEPLREVYSGVENNWVVDPVDLAAFNRFVDQMKVEFDKKKIATQQSLTYRYFRFFIDIAKLAIVRGGVKKGYRNNFVFWSVSLLYNARLVTLESLPSVCRDLQIICQDKYDVLESGSLSTLKEKIEIDENDRAKGTNTAPQPVAAQTGGFRCRSINSARGGEAKRVQGVWMSARHGKNSYRGMGRETYTPSVAYLIHHFGITAQEQMQMQTLTDEVEKSRRRSLNNKSHQLDARNRAIAEAVAGGMRADTAAIEFGVSRATVYRAIDKVAKEDAQQVERDISVDDNELMLQLGGFYRRTPFRSSIKTAPKSSSKKVSQTEKDALFTNDSHFLCPSKDGIVKQVTRGDMKSEARGIEIERKIEGREKKREKSPHPRSTFFAAIPPPLVEKCTYEYVKQATPHFDVAPLPSSDFSRHVYNRGTPLSSGSIVIPPLAVHARSVSGADSNKRLTGPVVFPKLPISASARNISIAPLPRFRKKRTDDDAELRRLILDVVSKRNQLEALELSRIDYLKVRSSKRETSKALSILDLAITSFHESVYSNSSNLASLQSLLSETKEDTILIVRSEQKLLDKTLYEMNALNTMKYPVAVRAEHIATLVDGIQQLRSSIENPSPAAQSLRSTSARYIDRFISSIEQNIVSTKQTREIDTAFNELISALHDESRTLKQEAMLCE